MKQSRKRQSINQSISIMGLRDASASKKVSVIIRIAVIFVGDGLRIYVVCYSSILPHHPCCQCWTFDSNDDYDDDDDDDDGNGGYK